MNLPVVPGTQADALILAVLILSVLTLGSLGGVWLKRRVARGQPHATIDNVVERVKSWWLLAGLVGLAFWIGPPGITGLFALAAWLALTEYLPAGRGAPSERLARRLAFWGVLPLQFILAVPAGGLWLLLPVAAAVVLLQWPRGPARRWSAPLQAGLLLCVLGISFVPALPALAPPGRGPYLLMFLLLVSQLGDVFQYLWGQLAGRRPLAPAISPGKTVEGLVGGVASATVLGAALAWTTPFTALGAAGAALLIALAGVLGGLLLSAAKRRRGIKDWSSRIPGHGGVLDRLDSLCLSAPLFYLLLSLAA
ncbi:MAG: phosphatidate cytidylyltransferase [Pseudomonadota bacterium]